jgi:opacity protein-like surface antigen
MQIKHHSALGLLLILILSPVAYAIPANLDVSAAVGPSWYDTNNSHMQVTSDENDTMRVSGASGAATYRVGMGYHFFATQLATRKFINDFLVQLNYYHGNTTINGQVMEFGSDCCVNYGFKAPVTSDRLMVDVKPSLFTVWHISPYVVAGAGVTWNQMSLSESPYGALFAPGTVKLPNDTDQNVAYDLGVGIRADISKNLSASIEYLSTHLGNAEPSSSSSTQQTILSAPDFPIFVQSILFGLNWKF